MDSKNFGDQDNSGSLVLFLCMGAGMGFQKTKTRSLLGNV